jgi:hypothetical protein
MNAQANDVASPAAVEKVKKKVEYETVTVEDGEDEKFAGDRQLNKTWKASADGTVTGRLAFRNGRVLAYSVTPNDVLREQFIGHGLLQKLGDETAGAKTQDDAVSWVENLIDLLKEGKWSEGRAPGSGETGGGVLAQAVFIMREEAQKPLTMEKVREYLRTKSAKEKIQLRGNPKIAAIIKRLSEEAGKASPEDASRLENELEALA